MNDNVSITSEKMYQELERDLLNFRIEPGEILSENQLCKRFGVSRTPVRSVLQRLQENRFVQIVPHKNTQVTLIDLDRVNQSIYHRVAVETMVLRDFIRICSPSDVERVRYAFSQMQALAAHEGERDGQDFLSSQFLRDDFTMHSIWFSVTHKEILWQQLSGVKADYTRFCMLDIKEGRNVSDVLAEHGAMLRLIDERNESGIEELMSRHLYGGVRRLSGLIYTKYASYFEALSLNGGRQA